MTDLVHAGRSEQLDSPSLRDDVIRHMVRNDDWPYRGLFERLALLRSSRAAVSFLEASVHPTAIDDATQKKRVERISTHRQNDGYSLQRTGTMSGSPTYAVVAHVPDSPADAAISSTLAKVEPDQVHARWTVALDRRAPDPAGAITLARTLIEDVCRRLLEAKAPAADLG
jgi:hypothetical protein